MNSDVVASDGVRLVVRQWGRPDAPTVLCVHGFPDDHTVWEGLAGDLAREWHVVALDVRGSGASDSTRRIRDYRLDQLADNLGRVIDAVAPGKPVHLVGHDWGSVQAWHAATEPGMRHRVASLTSISGPCLDAVPQWARMQLRSGAAGWMAVASMWKSPLYMGLLMTPVLGRLLCRLGLVDRAIELAHRFETGTRPAGLSARRAQNNRAAVKIYTANLLPRLLRPSRRHTSVPVQVLAPRRDIFITPASQHDVSPDLAPHAQIHSVAGGHWAPLFNPASITEQVHTFIRTTEDSTALTERNTR